MRFKPGQRVYAKLWGVYVEGTITEQRTPGIVWVLWDGYRTAKWAHVESVTLIGK